MKNSTLLASAAALSLLCAGTAMAQEVQPTTTNASTCRASPPHTWSGWGLDKYAQTEAEALTDVKLDAALKDAVDAGCMPAIVAVKIKEAVRANPNGTTTNGGLAVLPPGYHLDMMERGHDGPLLNVTVGRWQIAPGQVKAVEAKIWAVQYDGRVYLWILPIPCNNWSLLTMFVAPPLSDCAEVLVPAKAGDAVIWNNYGEYQPSACDAFMSPTDTSWQPMPTRCPETGCEPLRTVNGMRFRQGGGWQVEGQGGYYRVRVSKDFARHGLLYLCLKHGRRTSCGTKVQHDDYINWRVVMHYSLRAAEQDARATPVVRLLYFAWTRCLTRTQ